VHAPVMVDHEDVTVLIPTRNEAASIGEVVDQVRAEGFEDVLVIDGDSTDGTPDIAAEHGARVVKQTGSGKGQAVRQGIEAAERPYVLMLDGDGTYLPEDAGKFLDALDHSDHVVGNRFANMKPGAMPRLNRFGNRMISRSFEVIHGRDYGDILSGYRAFSKETLEKFDLSADGFGIETEMSVECVRHDVDTAVVPITYESRPAESETNLRPFRDGGKIVFTLYKLARTNNPLFFFGTLGLSSTAFGVVLAGYVAYDWFIAMPRQSHEVIAVVSAFAIVFGFQLLMFGVLSDLIVTLHRQQMRLLDDEE
jgi:glycosyltransferase (TIGR04182 family)